LALLAFTLSVVGSLQTAFGNAITEVNQSLLDSIRIDAPSPPVAARDIAMVNIAMYDAVNAVTGLKYRPYSYSGGTVSGVSAIAAAYTAGYTMLESLFPEQRSSLQSVAALALNNLELDDVVLTSSQNFGSSIANNFFNARANDGSATAQTTYTPGNQPGSY
jgi:hypothetical protein